MHIRRIAIAAGAVLLPDLLTKWLAERFLPGKELDLGIIRLSLSQNRGIAFGMLSRIPWAGSLLAVLLLLAAWRMLRKYRTTPAMETVIGITAGGAAGNLLQRLIFGYVTDMLFFPFLPWFICNAADIAVCCGAAVLFLSLLLYPQSWQEKESGGE